MLKNTPLAISEMLLGALGSRQYVYHKNRLPQDVSVIVVSNHRSFMDALVLIKALEQPIRIACHHYMGQTPVMKELVELLGCFPLDEPKKRQQEFFKRASQLLKTQQWVGIFPEGAQPMVQLTKPGEIGKLQRGFAHLALKVSVPNLAILPVAIASVEETIDQAVPLRLLSLLDPSEPLFARNGLHPVVTYRHVNVLIGHPYWITNKDRQQYQGKNAKQIVDYLCQYCQEEITQLLASGLS